DIASIAMPSALLKNTLARGSAVLVLALAMQACGQAPTAAPAAVAAAASSVRPLLADTVAIQLNQVGYLPGGAKWAVVRDVPAAPATLTTTCSCTPRPQAPAGPRAR